MQLVVPNAVRAAVTAAASTFKSISQMFFLFKLTDPLSNAPTSFGGVGYGGSAFVFVMKYRKRIDFKSVLRSFCHFSPQNKKEGLKSNGY